ncbi:MAG: flagellar biosynthesis protein FlhA [Pseudomonadota bacterium]|nr:flagellar biosynthesis protein FlhA [Pseudomonadota bacterium]MDE3036873.1 flagellar biosynthesis protein FlhA [Pseudomonadota bacterium]
MAEAAAATAPAPAAFSYANFSLQAGLLSKRRDIFFAVGIICILLTLILPLPPMLLDFALGISITLSVTILMTVLFVEKPLHLSSFPTILLIVTMLRLSLNIASVRLILAHGHEGTAAAGHVIQAFGGFVMGGSVVIGAIIFGILTIINFVVITKGSGRIAEVSARFSLDAMPGKQMAIDADLSAGLINEDQARSRRKELEDESNFFGAMDGASKFVRGDAIAGLLIVFINFIAGILIGVVQQGLSFNAALNTYTVLTVGDGLVTQIPALIVSTAAGILVTKSGVAGSAEKAVLGQLSRQPTALGVTSGFLVAMAALPGIPMLPFLILAGATGYACWYLIKHPGALQPIAPGGARQLTGPDGKTIDAKPAEEQPADFLHIDSLRLELGYGLLPLINYQKGHRLTEQIKALRRQMARELGFVIPAVRIQDNMQLPPNTYVVKLKEIEAARGDIKPDMLLVMNPAGGKIQLPGEGTTEPTFGLPAQWITESYREEALFKNYTVVDPPTVVTTHLTEVVKDNMAELLSYAETQKLLDDLGKTQQKLVAETIPSQITVGGVQRILQNLLREMVSVRDLSTILEAIAEGLRGTQNVALLTEHVRARLARQISHANTTEAGYIPIVALSPAWEQSFVEALASAGEDKTLSMAPSRIQEFIAATRSGFDRYTMQGELPVLLTSPAIRPYVRSIIERFRPSTVVLSQNEIYPKARLKTLGQL